MALRLRVLIYFAGLLFAGTSLAFADPVTVVDPHAGSVWQSWTASQISNQPWATSQQTPNQPYWNNSSWDGTNENVGGCLAKAGSGCAVSNQPGAIPYLGQSTGKAFSDFYLTSNGAATITLLGRNSADASSETLGWYNVQNPSQYQILFSGSTPAGETINFTPSAEYGFFFYNGVNEDMYFTNSNLNAIISNPFAKSQNDGPVDAGFQHFALFQQPAGTYYLGGEDLPRSNTDLDYNDMIVKVSTVATPEPSCGALLGCGLFAVGLARFRRNKTAKQPQTAADNT